MNMFKDKTLMITGGTGSFGNAVLNRFLQTDIGEIRIFSRDEKKQDDMRHEFQAKMPEVSDKIKFFIGDVRDLASVKNAIHGVDYIFHAAALKQVPSCEFFPIEAVKTNVLGTDNVLTAAIDEGVKTVICLSTDKAAYPVNAMGTSKAMMEKVIVAKSRTVSPDKTKICCTRYGNVMCSRGSVIPLWIEQIKEGKPITVTEPNMSSTGRTTTELHLAMLNKGIDSYVAYSKTNKPGDARLYHIGSPLDVKLHGLFSRISGEQAYFSHIATKKLIKHIDAVSPDVVHLRNLHGNYINFPMLMDYLAKKDIAVVVTFHDFWFITGKCVHFTESRCDKWQYGCGNCPNLKDGNPTWFFDRTEKLLRDKTELFGEINRLALIGVSNYVTNEVKKSPIAKKAKIVKTIYNWIDFDKFYPRDAGRAREKYGLNGFTVIGISAVWSDRKGLKSFIRLAEECPEITVVLVGSLKGNTVLPKNITAVSATSSTDELAELYSAADVFITFSLEETFGKVSAEALSCGTPVICYDSTANPEIVGDGCGYVVPKNDFEGILNAVKKVRENGKNSYSSACVNFAHDRFDKNMLIDRYIGVYKQLSKPSPEEKE
jgi:glycosyltransferase involved in cell wall biosynthesis/NADP-dependent 3-hydroxy acid dehydrogenase YdfG